MDEDIGALGADGFANADFAGSLGHGDQHDVHHTDAAYDQADGSYGEHQNKNEAADFFPEVEKIVRSENREIIGLVVGKAALAAKEVAHFVDGFADVIGIGGFREDDVVFSIGIEFAQSGDRHVGGVVFRIRAAGDALALFLERADDGEELAVDGDFLADGFGGGFGEQGSYSVVAEEDHGSAMLGVGLVKEAASFNF